MRIDKKMKQKYLYKVICLAISLMACTACDDDERGMAVSLDTSACPGEEVRDVTLWLFDADDRLQQTFAYPTAEELATALPEVAAGRYTLVAATNIEGRFTCRATSETTASRDLLLEYTAEDGIDAAPANVHYGTRAVEVAADGITRATVPVKGMLARLALSVQGLSESVHSVKAEIRNAATGFYPATGQPSETTKTLTVGTATPQDTRSPAVAKKAAAAATETDKLTATFPSAWLMPTVGKALLRLTFDYGDGLEQSVDVTLDHLATGGDYQATLNYNDANPEIRLDIVAISGWAEGGSIGEGEATEN